MIYCPECGSDTIVIVELREQAFMRKQTSEGIVEIGASQKFKILKTEHQCCACYTRWDKVLDENK